MRKVGEGVVSGAVGSYVGGWGVWRIVWKNCGVVFGKRDGKEVCVCFLLRFYSFLFELRGFVGAAIFSFLDFRVVDVRYVVGFFRSVWGFILDFYIKWD